MDRTPFSHSPIESGADRDALSGAGRDAFFNIGITALRQRAVCALVYILLILSFLLLMALLSGIVPTGSTMALSAEIEHTRLAPSAPRGDEDARTGRAATARVRARLWGLSEAEYARYEQLMQGIRGSISPSTLSPIEVLGIHARDDEERRRYAETWARMLHEDVARIAAFDTAYSEAVTRLGYRSGPARQAALRPGDRILFFASPGCQSCVIALGRLMGYVREDKVQGLDIYLVGDLSDEAVRRWARGQGITPELVRSRKVTLNHDRGTLARLGGGLTATVPYALRSRGKGSYARIDLERM